MGADPLNTDFEQPARWVSSARTYIYATVFALIFGLAAGQIGIVSDLFQAFGNGRNPEQFLWPSNEALHVTGLVLASALITLLLCIGAYWCPPIPLLFVLFALTGLWVSAGAVLESMGNYRAGCKNASFVGQYAIAQSHCEEFVAMEALSWALFGIVFLTLVALIYEFFGRKTKKQRTLFGV